MKNDVLISIDSYLLDFKKYLDNNHRSILSARFGDGKSFFLSQFMQQYKDDYLFIPIYPVNYQVADNKDIFEYIKRDILIRLLGEDNIIIDETVIGTSNLLFAYFDNNKCDTVLDLLSIIPDINVYGIDLKIGNVFEKIEYIKNKFLDFKKHFKNEKEQSEDFVNLFKKKEGSIYEYDTLSQLICDLIINYRKNNKQEVVLIIEDLDRIDPSQVFRILNIFSAHFDRYNQSIEEISKTFGENKFCFDKIISVCDFNNLQSIYEHLYGKNTDFNGYISKFTSSYPFRYNLRDNFKNYFLNNLIDKDLIKFKNISDALADFIVDGYYDIQGVIDYNGDNLRNIIHSLSKKEVIIREKSISDVNSINDLTKLLATIHSFGYEYDTFDKYIKKRGLDNAGTNKEFYQLIGPCWITALLFDATISLRKYIEQKSVEIVAGSSVCVTYKALYDNNKLVYLDITSRDDYYGDAISNKIRKYKDRIIKLFEKELISV